MNHLTSDPTGQTKNPGSVRRFQVPPGIKSFCGRQEILQKLHSSLQQNRVTILTQVKVDEPGGGNFGGIGKTQTALKYISQFSSCYDNIVWIEAETESTLQNSFLKIADALKVPTRNSQGQGQGQGQIDRLEVIVCRVYQKLFAGEKPTFVIFDNAEDHKIEKYWPSTVDPGLTSGKLAVLVTSRNPDWKGSHVLPLDLFSRDEALDFIKKELNIPEWASHDLREETREFTELVGGLPLALQISLAYIKEEEIFSGQLRNFSGYLQKFKSTARKILGSPSTILVTSSVTLEKVTESEDGKLAVQIIETLALLYPDKIPTIFIESIFPDLDPSEISDSLTLLEKYSLITLQNGRTPQQKFVTIHRQLQFSILQHLKNESGNSLKTLFDDIFDRCKEILSETSLGKNPDILMSIVRLVENPFDLVPGHNKETLLLELRKINGVSDLLRDYFPEKTGNPAEGHPPVLKPPSVTSDAAKGQIQEGLELPGRVLEEQKPVLGKDPVVPKRAELTIEYPGQKMPSKPESKSNPASPAVETAENTKSCCVIF